MCHSFRDVETIGQGSRGIEEKTILNQHHNDYEIEIMKTKNY